jgi:hypothetical protein
MTAMPALAHWHEFYILLGTAAATLLALLYVAVSLGAGFLSERRTAPTRAFFSPVVVHFTAVFFVSALALVPEHGADFYAELIAGCAVIGGAVAAFATVQILRHDWTRYLQDHFGYGIGPALCYVALLVAAGLIETGHDAAFDLLGAALIALLIVNVRNAWDLTLSMVQRQTSRERHEKRRR